MDDVVACLLLYICCDAYMTSSAPERFRRSWFWGVTEGSKRDKFWMYPRFLQIILNVNHAELQRGNDILDFKSIGPSAFGLMKQKRGGKFVFEGKFPLIKFGIFKEDDREESEDQSVPIENEDIHHSPSEPEVEDIHHSPTACVADEHDYQKANDSKSSRGDDDDNLYDDEEFLKEIDFTGFNDDIPTNIEFDLGDEDFDCLLNIPSSRANKVNEVASLATKTRDEGNFLKILLSTSKPLEVSTSQGDVRSEIPPSVSLVSTSVPIISDFSEPQISQTSIRTSQFLESLVIPAVKSVPQVTSTITATSAHSPPKQTDEGPSTIFETGGSSFIPEYSPTRPSLDEASIRLVRHLAQSNDEKFSSSEPREEIGVLRQQLIEKSIQMDQLSTFVFELRAKDEEKTKQIKDLQTSLGSILASYFNLKNVLYDAFGEKVKALFQQPHGVVDPPSAQSPAETDDLPGKRIVTANQREGLLFMKNTNENRKAKDPALTVTDLKKRMFGDKYGDRSGIRMWAFDPETNLWVVKRNSGISECYKSTHDFNSWTKTDLAELSRVPFHNSSQDPSASNFKRFLDRQVKENFPSMKTAKALYRKDKDVIDPETDKPVKIILWPATKKQKEIPIPQHFQE
ncbi:hypothetical protein Lser_V15G22580 [Lactuca serriola]